jgi:hypothetical protein
MDKDMDLVYICRDGENEELRYSIRSAVNNLPHDKIWVVGGKPDWYTGNYIEVNQGRAKYTNARNSLKAICDSEEISESFILMNDDFYIINKVESVPYMYAGTLDDKIKQREDIFNGNTYTTLLRKTLGYLYRKKINVVLDISFVSIETNISSDDQKSIDDLLQFGHTELYKLFSSIITDKTKKLIK